MSDYLHCEGVYRFIGEMMKESENEGVKCKNPHFGWGFLLRFVMLGT